MDDQDSTGPNDEPDGHAAHDPADGAADDDGSGPAAGQAEDEAVASLPGPPARMSRSRMAVLIGSVVAAVAVLAGLAFLTGDPEPVAAPATSAPTTTTTTAPVGRAATDVQVATANGPTVLVRSAPPDGWDTMAPVTVWDNPPPPASQPNMPERPALPRPDFPIQGRYSDAAGWTFDNPTAFGDPFVMMVTEQRGDWLKVQVPVRPNGTEGYVLASDVTLSTHQYRIELMLSERMLRVYNGSDLVVETAVVVGKDDTRTPTGRFYVTDTVPQSNPAGAYGPIALATSGYSEQLDIFDNGVPVIAMHGTNKPELVGQAISNGCIRMPNDVITRLGNEVPLGTPVDIYA